MFVELLEFLAGNKAVLIGAAVTVGELLVIAVNTYRKLRADKAKDAEITTLEAKPKRSVSSTLLWSANPINLFRKP